MTLAGAWFRLRCARLGLHLHVAIPLVAGGLALLSGSLVLRYLLLLATLLLHEAAHAAAAVALGGHRAEVRLWPWFGRADVPRLRGWREAVTALAAPSANLALAAVLILGYDAQVTLALGRCPLPDLLASANLLMGAGNLLPVPPVDGGRAVAALFRAGPGRRQA